MAINLIWFIVRHVIIKSTNRQTISRPYIDANVNRLNEKQKPMVTVDMRNQIVRKQNMYECARIDTMQYD